MANDIPMKMRFKAVDKISGAIGKLKSKFAPLSKSVERVNNKFRIMKARTAGVKKGFASLGKGMQNVGKGMAIGLTAPITAIGVASVKMFGDFDNSMRGVKTLLDESSFGAKSLSKGFNEMKKGALDIVKKIPVGLSGVTSALFDTVSAGIDAGDAVKFVAASAKLAVAGITDVSIATDGMTSAMNAFGFASKDAEKIAAKFFIAQKAGKTTIADLSKDLGKVASLAATAGVSFDEVLASVSAATLGGIKTNQAYTSMKAVFSNIIKPTADAKKAAKLIGVEFNSTALKSKGFTKFMQDIIDKSKKMGVDPSKAFEKLFGSTEALNFALTIGGTQLDAYRSTLSKLKDEAKAAAIFQKAYAEQSASFNNSMKLLTNSMNVLGVTIGAKMAPTIERFAKFIIKIIGLIQKLNPSVLKWSIAISAVVAVIGPLLLALGFMISLVPGIITGLTIITASFGGLGASIWAALTPLLPFIAAAALLAGAAFLVYKNWGPISDFLTDVFTKPIETIKEMLGWAGSLAKKVGSFFGIGDGESDVDKKLKAQGFKINEGGPSGEPLGAKDITKQSNDFKARQRNAQVNVNFSNIPKDTSVITEDKDDLLMVDTGMVGAF